MVADQNREMAPLGLQIRAAACPTDAARRRWVGLANADADAPARQFGSRYSVQEREFFRATVRWWWWGARVCVVGGGIEVLRGRGEKEGGEGREGSRGKAQHRRRGRETN